MKIHFTSDEDKVFNVPRFVVRVEAENKIALYLPLGGVWKAGVVLGFGFALGMMGYLVLTTVVSALWKGIL